MLARPKKSTLDAWLDEFTSWPNEDRAGALAFAERAHRTACVVEKRFVKEQEVKEQEVKEQEVLMLREEASDVAD
jgi:hypothetical protein